MKTAFAIIALGFSLSCGGGHIGEMPTLGPQRQCNLPLTVSCVDLDPTKHKVCELHILNAVAEINGVSGRELLAYRVYNGTLPVVFSADMHLGGPNWVQLGETNFIAAHDGCIHMASIVLSPELLGKSYWPRMYEVVLHEVLHALGQGHSEDGVMTPAINDKGHTAHMSANDIARLMAVYGE